MRVRGPEGPEDEQSLVSLSALASATICFSQLSSKSRISRLNQKALMSAKIDENRVGSLYLRHQYHVKKSKRFIDHVKSYTRLKFSKIEVFVSN